MINTPFIILRSLMDDFLHLLYLELQPKQGRGDLNRPQFFAQGIKFDKTRKMGSQESPSTKAMLTLIERKGCPRAASSKGNGL
jgi:hypothetical protein